MNLYLSLAQHLDTDNFRTLRLVNRFFLDICAPYFSITLDIDDLKRNSDVGVMFVLLQNNMDGREPQNGAQGRWTRNPFDQNQGPQGGVGTQSLPLPLHGCSWG